MRHSIYIVCCAWAMIAAPASAQQMPGPAFAPPALASKEDPFTQTKLVAFNYSDNETYPVVSRAGMNSVIEVPEGEAVQGFYLSDTAQWGFHIAGDKRHVFVKPNAGGLFNTGTLITDKRTYLLAMTSSTSGVWYQQVRWIIPSETKGGDAGSYEDFDAGVMSVKADGSPNFEYDIEGDADFRPLSVYDNGKFTRFVLSKNVMELPALFSLNSEGEPEVVNYIVTGNALQVNRLMAGALLKLGDKEVRVYNRSMRPAKKSWFNFSGWGN